MRGLLICMMALLLTGCLASPDWSDPFASVMSNKDDAKPLPDNMQVNGRTYTPDSRDRARHQQQAVTQRPVWRQPQHRFYAETMHKSLADYAEQLAMQLIKHANGISSASRIGVVSFVAFDASLQNTSVVGNQLAEYTMVQLQQLGVNVVDFKLQDGIAVGRHGDIVLSRDEDDLANELALDYVLTGTMIENPRGLTINARIAHLDNKRLASSATLQIPRIVVEQLMPDSYVAAD
ncbi:FlgO family outer membrane protein [Aestuariibacter salexigens]|uniref:FlgO family outer membrane protein n=1 Tax=Aestuariibacter salexigens TaxID=226010 RepID=UPI000414AC48|nr:FlgO family outer membrane protein [Aestuariibacter salexigens]